jgi:hypothetical protein
MNYCILIYTHCQGLTKLVVMVICHCYSWWNGCSYTLWVTLIRLHLYSYSVTFKVLLCSFLCNCIDMQHLTDVQASRCWICNFEVLNLCCVIKCSSLMELLLGVCRFVSTSVTSVHQMENGFNIWSFNGKLLYRLSRDRFFQVCLLNLAM